VAKDQAQGISWLEKAARQGSIFADTTLGDAYSNGIGVSVDQARAIGYFRNAAEQNYAPAQLKLASALYLGRGVARDPVQAFKWAYLSALQLSAASPIVEKFRKELPAPQLAQGEAAAKQWLSTRGQVAAGR
jgi:TPR repeat protein